MKKTTKKKSVLALMKSLVVCVRDLGWDIAVPKAKEDDKVRGMIIGENFYVDSVTKALDKAKWKLPKPKKEKS